MRFDEDWPERMPWVAAMPGNKTYVLWEAQKEIECLRQEIKCLHRENSELQACVTEAEGLPEGHVPPEPKGRISEAKPIELRIGDNLVEMGVIKILGPGNIYTLGAQMPG